jgi:signal transduction histidine kinase/ActR/RegA family two-component response regulator
MDDLKKTKKQLIQELEALRKTVSELEKSESETEGAGRGLTEKIEAVQALQRSEEALRFFHEIVSAQNVLLNEKFRNLLSMGCLRYNLPIGILAQIEEERYEVMEVVAPENTISKGDVFPLGQTYCRETIQSDVPVYFLQASRSDWKSHPAFIKFKLESYIAISVKVGDKVFGTINFSSPEPREVNFTFTDKEILKLMAQWVGGELEREKMQEELLKVEKLESVGLLAGGIAHDFNNILTAILGNISLAQSYTQPGSEALQILAEAEKAAFGAKDLTQQLLTFARGGEPVKKKASIADIIRKEATFALRGSNVSCAFSFPQDLRIVEIDTGQIGQVIHNLIINADQASPEGGVIKVSAKNFLLKEGDRSQPLKNGNYVRISIQDQGIGIREQDLFKIFDPYFTTKQKGSGLGLAASYSIIKKHQGHIEVASSIGTGTTFHIYLSASEGKLDAPPPRVDAPMKPGQGNILLMDDEEMVCKTASALLQKLGYSVLVSKDGAEMLTAYCDAKEKGQAFDAVIMDLTVPGGMGGKEAIGRLLRIDPKAKAIVSSGYSNDPVMGNYNKLGFQGVVAKPYNMSELHEVLKKVLGNSGKDPESMEP